MREGVRLSDRVVGSSQISELQLVSDRFSLSLVGRGERVGVRGVCLQSPLTPALSPSEGKMSSGADGGARTPTLFRVPDFESSASANSATSAPQIVGPTLSIPA